MVSKPYARLRLKFAISLARFIQRHRKGDTRIFDNMVDARGKGIVTEAILTKNIKAITEQAKVHYPVATRQLLNWLQ